VINASSLSPRTLTKDTGKTFIRTLQQEEREPWLREALKCAARERLVRLLGAEEWHIFSFAAEELAKSWICRSLGLKALLLGSNAIAYRDSRDSWLPHLQGWEEQGVCWFLSRDPGHVPKRASIWIQSLCCPVTGAIFGGEPHVSVPVCADWGDRLALQPADESLWKQELPSADIHIIPLHGIAGAAAPTMMLIRRSIANQWPELIVAAEQGSSAALLVTAANALEEWSKHPDDGFEASRFRASVENLLRAEVQATILDEHRERAPQISGMLIPGVSSELTRLIFEQHGIYCTETSSAVAIPSMTISLAGRAAEWQAIASKGAAIADALHHAQRISEGCCAWPLLLAAERDPHINHSDVRKKSTRPLYAGLIRPEHTMEGLRRVAATARSPGTELYLQLLVDEEDGSIADAAYQAMGPPTLIALGEALSELLIRRTHREAQLMRASQVEEHLFGEGAEAEGVAKQWSNLWLEALEECCSQVADISCPEPVLETPFSAEGLIPGEPYPGWDEMDLSARTAIIEQCLDAEVRPYIALDAGGIEVLSLHELTLKIRYSGTCTSCPSSIGSTLRAIQQTLQARIHPEIVVEPELSLQS